MTDYKILFLDIDGTILRPDDTIEDSTKKVVAEMQQKGMEVFLATGRPLHEISDLGKELNIHSFIGYNGAYAIYKGKDVLKEPMDSHTVKDFLDIAQQHGHEAVMYTHDKNVVTNLNAPIMQEFLEKFHLQKNELFSPEILHHVLGMTLVNLSENEPALYEQDHNVHLSQVNVEGFRHSYDVIRDSVNKGFAVEIILKRLAISKEQAIAFGDGMNDKEMLKAVGEGFAMGNAHPDLFAYAKHKTTTVTNSGIYNGLKTLGLVN
ncbi:HAD family hydrolase [Priestia abyssalis]|uniref:HAD family hydrolase n=1 Tax=Priestia abyssalis TaxID=1221450 RepID=UPI000994A6B5|nr:HAD family hydrolase [Priestia abyssalis]